jgi:hypothetical protein
VIGYGGWGMGPNPQSPNPQSPIPNPHLNDNLNKFEILFKFILNLIKLIIIHYSSFKSNFKNGNSK